MILINSAFWTSVGVSESDGNPNGNQYGFYNTIEMSNAVTVKNQYEFFLNSPVNGIYYNNQYEWYRAIGLFHSEPIYDMYSFYNNVTIDGVNPVRDQYEFFKSLKDSISSSFIVASSFLLDGVNEGFYTTDIPKFEALLSGDVGFTMTFSFKRGAIGTDQALFGDHGSRFMIRIIGLTNRLQVDLDDGTTQAKSVGSTAITSTTEWQTAVITFNYANPLGSRTGIYLNGVDEAPVDATTKSLMNGSNIYIGLRSGVNYWNGNMGQVSIIDRVLTPSEISNWHNSGQPKDPQALFGNDTKYFFNPDNSGSTAEFTVLDSVNDITMVSFNLEDQDKTNQTPYP